MKILHVIASLAPESGGPAKACLEMAQAVARRGHQVAIFTTDRALTGTPSEPAPTTRDGVSIRWFPTQPPRALGTSWPLAAALRAEIRRYDVVHLHSLYLFHDWATARACRRAAIPYLLRPHGSLDPFQYRQHRWRKVVAEQLFQNRVTRGAALLHYTSKEEMLRSAPQALGRPGVVVPIGLEPGEYAGARRGGFRARHPALGRRPILLFMGRLHAKKGLDLLAEAFIRCVRAGSDAQLVIAGPDDGMAEPVRRMLAAAGLAERASFTGMVRGAEKLELLADADLFVLASHSENFGIAVVEALACGVPVLISDGVNLWREIEAAQCGRVVPLDADRLAAAIAEMLRDPAGLRAMGEHGRALVAERFAWPSIAERLEAVYRQVAATR